MRSLLAGALLAALAGTAAAEPVTVTDALGQAYRLSDDGSYAIVAKDASGKEYFLSPATGTWLDADIDAALAKRVNLWLEEAYKSGSPPPVREEDREIYADCLAAGVAALPAGAKRIMLAASDPREAFNQLERQYKDEARALTRSDRECRNLVRPPDPVPPAEVKP